jgi:acyl-CoA synthetase (AMP-forming)/AMP-acid ligase II
VALVHDARFTEQTAAVRERIARDRVVVVDGDAPGFRTTGFSRAPTTAHCRHCRTRHCAACTTPPARPGAPKGAKRTHRNWFANVVNMTHDVLGGPPRENDVYVHAGPVTHTSGLFVLPFLVAGARQIVLPSWDPEAFLDAVEHRGATHTALVPTMVARLVAMPGIATERLRGLRMLGYAGAPMPPEQMRAASELLTPNLVQYYGLVEAIPPVTVLDADDHARGLADEPELLSSAGRPALGVELAVVDERGVPLPAGEVGEVVTRGDHVMPGYWDASGVRTSARPSSTGGCTPATSAGSTPRAALPRRPQGRHDHHGRLQRLPAEVEDAIAEVPGVHEVAVLGVDDPTGASGSRPSTPCTPARPSLLTRCSSTAAAAWPRTRSPRTSAGRRVPAQLDGQDREEGAARAAGCRAGGH